MQTKSLGQQSSERDRSLLRRVSWFGALLLLCFLVIYCLSPPFEFDSDLKGSTLIVTGLLLLSSIAAFFALGQAIQIPASNRQLQRQLLLLIVAVALSTRLVALFTCPILELDYYRYIWDGRVAAEGISPYRYAPEQILNAPLDATGPLRDLNSLANRTESNHTILSRIHFEKHTTIYPPVSQLVFTVAMSVVPESASVNAQITFMKFVLLLFDLGTLFLVFCLLKALNRHVGWLIVYAWNPLVIKEIANGGHLDSIATWLTVLSVFAFVHWWRSEKQRASLVMMSAVALGLGVGAKLFSVVVFPVLFVVMFRKHRVAACVFSAVFASVAVAALWPMFSSMPDRQVAQRSNVQDKIEAKRGLTESDHNRDAVNRESLKNREGLTAFLSSWRMNDVVFSSVYLNLKDVQRGTKQAPWFVFTSKEFRNDFRRWCKERNFGGEDPAYSTTRVLTLGLFSAFFLYQLFLISKVDGDSNHVMVQMLQRIGWILVIFLLLQPTVNPWYLLWALPFCSFSNNRGWLLVSGVLLIYYSRFWFRSLEAGAIYTGEGLFDHFVAWGEHLVMVTIILSFLISQRRLGVGSDAE